MWVINTTHRTREAHTQKGLGMVAKKISVYYTTDDEQPLIHGNTKTTIEAHT